MEEEKKSCVEGYYDHLKKTRPIYVEDSFDSVQEDFDFETFEEIRDTAVSTGDNLDRLTKEDAVDILKGLLNEEFLCLSCGDLVKAKDMAIKVKNGVYPDYGFCHECARKYRSENESLGSMSNKGVYALSFDMEELILSKINAGVKQ